MVSEVSMLSRYIGWIPLAATVLAIPASAFDTIECTEMARACLSRSTSAKDACFRSVSASPVCVGSEMGDLIAKRARISSAYPDSEDAGPGFLGPQILDQSCVDAFDTRLRLGLAVGTPSADDVSVLSRFLDRCVQPPSPNLYRP